MFKYGRKSKAQWNTLHPWLQLILLKLLLKHDHSVRDGGRTEKQQWELYRSKPQRSTLHPPKGKHLLRKDLTRRSDKNLYSFAVDIVPYINGKALATSKNKFGPNQRAQFTYFLGILKVIADNVLEGTEYEIRLGINWDQDQEILTDQKFQDFFHIELVKKKN